MEPTWLDEMRTDGTGPEFVAQHVDDVVVAADHDQGLVQLRFGHEELGAHQGAGLGAFGVGRDARHALAR
jgi:hypothetical protein